MEDQQDQDQQGSAESPPTAEQDQQAARPARHPLSMIDGEDKERHRAFILWCCMDADSRSYRLVSRAIGRSAKTPGNWAKDHGWHARAREAGPACQSMALRIYREHYLATYGRLELEAIRLNISIPLVPGDPVDIAPPDSVSKGQVVIGREAMTVKACNVQGSRGTRDKDVMRERQLEIARRGAKVMDAIIAHAAQKLLRKDKGGGLSITARDVPYVATARLELERLIQQLEAGEAERAHGVVEVPESFRVRQARATGGDVLRALADDVADLAVTTRALAQQARQTEREQSGQAGG